MSVLIRGMEMPTSCRDCPCFCEEYFYCRAKEGDDIGLENRPKDCPLFTVPPHGRLIDADALMKRFEKEEKAADEHGRDFSFSFKSGGQNFTEWWSVQNMLMDAPTIIEAEVTE